MSWAKIIKGVFTFIVPNIQVVNCTPWVNFVGEHLSLSMKIIVTLLPLFLFSLNGSTADPDFLREPLVLPFTSLLCPAGHTLEPLYFSPASVPWPLFPSSLGSCSILLPQLLFQSIFISGSSTYQSQDDLYTGSVWSFCYSLRTCQYIFFKRRCQGPVEHGLCLCFEPYLHVLFLFLHLVCCSPDSFRSLPSSHKCWCSPSPRPSFRV